jgi:dTDP-4-amino-4,6-dideoxygalactose transaminase
MNTGERIPVFRPLLGPEELAAAQASLEAGWLGMGKSVGQFEDALRAILETDSRHVVAVSTGHAALHLGLLLAGVGPGDEVLTPSFNNIADLQAILAVGARPVFCDVRDDTLCIDLDRAEELIGPRTRALIVMDYACHVCDHDRAAALAERRGLRVLHDAAHAFGSRYRGRPVGSFSDLTMFSFDPVKTITCIDGGALVVRTAAQAEAARQMRLLGMDQAPAVMYQDRRAWTYDVSRLGFRYHLANLHAALGLAQLARLPEISRTRRAACRHYNRRLALVPRVKVPPTDFGEGTPFLYYIRVPAAERAGLQAHLAEHGVETGIHWQPGHGFSLFQGTRRGELSVTERVGREILTLPLHSCMATPTVERVCDAVVSYFARG